MKCVICGKEIDSTDRRVHYCSDACREKGKKGQMLMANKKRRETDPTYLKKTNDGNRRRYHIKKHLRYIELANEIQNNHWDTDSLVEFLENSFRLRH